MTPVMARQKHDRQASDAAAPDLRRRLAPRTGNGLLARILKPGQIIDAGAADDAENRLRHAFPFSIRSAALARGRNSKRVSSPILMGEYVADKNAGNARDSTRTDLT